MYAQKNPEKNEIKSRADAKFSVSKKFKKKINIKYTLHVFSHLVICVFSRYRFFSCWEKNKNENQHVQGKKKSTRQP